MPKTETVPNTSLVEALVWSRDDGGGYMPKPVDRFFLRDCPIAVSELGVRIAEHLLNSGDAFKKVEVTEEELRISRARIAQHEAWLDSEKRTD